VILAFVVPIIIITLLINFATSTPRDGAGADSMSEEAIAARIKPVAVLELRDASGPRTLKSGEDVFKLQCGTCHSAGLAGAPKLGDKDAWAPRIKTGYDALLHSALKGKGAMAPQSGGDYEDIEIGRAVVYMANQAGGNLPEPAEPKPAAGDKAADGAK